MNGAMRGRAGSTSKLKGKKEPTKLKCAKCYRVPDGLVNYICMVASQTGPVRTTTENIFPTISE